MDLERIKVERHDHHILPFRRTERKPIPLAEDKITLKDIGALRFRELANGQISAEANLLGGVKITRVGEKTKTVYTLPNAPSKQEPLTLSSKPIGLERQRFARGKSVVVISVQ